MVEKNLWGWGEGKKVADQDERPKVLECRKDYTSTRFPVSVMVR